MFAWCPRLVIQDRDVQMLMDGLDLPPDRANLFERLGTAGPAVADVVPRRWMRMDHVFLLDNRQGWAWDVRFSHTM